MNRDKILKRYDPDQYNLLAILHDIQDNSPQHYLSSDDLKATADYLKLSLSYVHGVATFYTMYSLKPRGRHIVRICQSPPCHLMGSTDVSRELMRTLGVGFGETTADGQFTLEMTSCLGVCGVAPAMMIDDEVYGNLSVEKIERIIAAVRSAK